MIDLNIETAPPSNLLWHTCLLYSYQVGLVSRSNVSNLARMMFSSSLDTLKQLSMNGGGSELKLLWIFLCYDPL